MATATVVIAFVCIRAAGASPVLHEKPFEAPSRFMLRVFVSGTLLSGTAKVQRLSNPTLYPHSGALFLETGRHQLIVETFSSCVQAI